MAKSHKKRRPMKSRKSGLKTIKRIKDNNKLLVKFK